MKTRTITRLVHEGWLPYLSLEDVYKLDNVRQALLSGDTHTATLSGKVFVLTPIKD